MAAKYLTRDERRQERRPDLIAYRNKPDVEQYTVALREIFDLFGQGIHESLARTCSDYLEEHDGKFANSKLSEKAVERTAPLVCHNNHAERPFAVIKSMAKLYPSMRLDALTHLARARLNGTFKVVGKGPTALFGACVLAPPEVQKVMSELCSVRSCSLGAVVKLKRADRNNDWKDGTEMRKKKRADKKTKEERLLLKRAAAANDAQEAELLETPAAVVLELRSLDTMKSKMALLTHEFDSRVNRGREYPMSLIGMESRLSSKGFKLRKTPMESKPTSTRKFEYMKELVLAMVGHDHAVGRVNAVGVVEFKGPRINPVISARSTSAACITLKEEYQQSQIEAARPVDDPLLLELEEKYLGKILYDNDGKNMTFGGKKKKHKLTYRIAKVQWGDIGGPPYYEATCVPVEKGTTGTWEIAAECRVDGSDTVYARKYELGVNLACLKDVDNPTRLEYADEYIVAHENRERGETAVTPATAVLPPCKKQRKR